jgi:hypothetical protein
MGGFLLKKIRLWILQNNEETQERLQRKIAMSFFGESVIKFDCDGHVLT